MALKKQQSMLDTFSMASMTDVVFLLLVFFMVTSTFIFPTAMEVNLPQSTEQTPLKPQTKVIIREDGSIAGQFGEGDEVGFDTEEQFVTFLKQVTEQDSVAAIAVWGDKNVKYERIIEVLNVGAKNNIRMVLATTPNSTAPKTDEGAPAYNNDGK